MLFLFRGRHGPAVRAIVGVPLLLVGILVPGWSLLIAAGAVLIAWGGIGALTAQRANRRRPS